MGTMRRAWVLALIGALAAAFAACDTETPNSDACSPGDFERIALADGGASFLQCTAEGGAYVAYDGPDPNALADVAVADASGDAPSACDPAANGGKLPFMCFGCTVDGDCAAGLVCFSFPNKGGNVCTRVCSTASQCPTPPSGGCGNNGHCKPE